MQRCLRLFSPKFLPNRERIMFKDGKEAFSDFWRVSCATFLFNLGFAAFIVSEREYLSQMDPAFVDFETFREFGFPTPDIVYDIKRIISPDFDLFCRYGEKAEFRLDLSNQIAQFKKEEELFKKSRASQRSPEARFGGAV
uniref:Uncharacterized protein n=1 Tax=Angiostrongylus cantonensis TaxID=6313 RepID=A0A0K0DDT1_ANGCA